MQKKMSKQEILARLVELHDEVLRINARMAEIKKEVADLTALNASMKQQSSSSHQVSEGVNHATDS